MGSMNPQVWRLSQRFALAVILLVAMTGAAQQTQPSHAERFTDPRAKLEQKEQEATARLRANPKDSQALIDRGLARLGLGQLGKAVEDLNQAAQLDPKSADARAQLAYGLWQLGRLEEALAAARAALALNPDDASAHYYAGRLLLESDGDIHEAVQHLQRAVELSPDDINFRFDLLNAYSRLGDWMRMGVELRLLRVTLPPSDPRVPYAEGLLAAGLGHVSAAVEDFRRALEANPRFVPARYDLARALVQTDHWKEALEVLGPLTRDYPQSYTAAYLHALALQNARRGRVAEEEARRALHLNPESADAQTLLGITLAEEGKYNDALSALESAVRLEPKSFDAQLYLGRARYALRDLAGARDAFRAATLIKPDEIEAHFFLATALEGLGDSDAALAQYREMTQRFPKDPRGYVGLGSSQAKHGQVDQALATMRQALELDPENFEATLGLGKLLAREGQLPEAIRLLRQATTIAADSTEAHFQLGLALRRAGRTVEAGQEFAIVEQLNQRYRKQGGGTEPPSAQPPGDR